MANSAFTHNPSITVPGSSTNTALVRWSSTGADTFLDSTILVGATTMGLAADTDLLTFGNGTLAITGTVTGISTITATTFSGALSGNATSATSAATLTTARAIGGVNFNGSAAIVPTTIAVTDTTDTTAFVGLFESATGDLLPKTDAALTYNAGTGALTAVTFHGSGANLTNLPAGGIASVAADTSPQLGGSLDAQNNTILNVGNANSDWTAGVLTVAAAGSSSSANRTNLDSYNTNTDGGAIQFRHSKSSTLGSHAALVSGDDLGKIRFFGSGGSAFSIGAIIQAKATETFSNGSSNFGTKLEFYTTDNTTDTNDLRMTIDHDGEVTVKENDSSPSVTKGIAKAWGMVRTAQDDVTISYNIDSSGTNAGTGFTTITFTTDMENSNYACVGSRENGVICFNSKATTGVRVDSRDYGGSGEDSGECYVAFFGEAT